LLTLIGRSEGGGAAGEHHRGCSRPALRAYLAYFNLDVVGLTGTRAEIDAVAGAYGASYEIQPSRSAAGPNVAHTTQLFVIGPDDRLVTALGQRDSAEVVAAAVRAAAWPSRLWWYRPALAFGVTVADVDVDHAR
jgi:hypothetical protein